MVDFAYHVHTDVGNQMVGAKVNGKVVPYHHELQNAEVVEILTYGKETSAQDVLRHMARRPHPSATSLVAVTASLVACLLSDVEGQYVLYSSAARGPNSMLNMPRMAAAEL